LSKTNHYGQYKIATKTNCGPLWKDTTTEEIRVYLGVTILMGIKNGPEMRWMGQGMIG